MPLEDSVSGIAVPSSTIRFTVPVGVRVPVAAVTVTVKVSEAPTFGAVFAAVIVVVVSISDEIIVLAGHAVARLLASTDPRPVTWL